MSQIQQSEQRCLQCGSIEHLFVSLDCEHSFCLVCMSYVVIKSKTQKTGGNLVVCPICEHPTNLDAESVEAIQQTIENIIIPNLNSFPIPELSAQNNDNLEELQKYHAVSLKKSSDDTNAPSINIPREKPSIKISKRFSEDPNFDHQSPTANKYFFSKCMTPVNNSRDSLTFRECCSIHPLQEITSVCLSCDNQMVCTKCLLMSKHKGHNVKILSKGVQFLIEEANFKKFDINHKLENLELHQKRIKDKVEFLKQRLFKSQENITESFEQVICQIKRRQSQLQQECLEIYHSFQQVLNQELLSINQQILTLSFSKENIQSLLTLDKPFEFLKNYTEMISMQPQVEQYVPKTKMQFQSNSYLQISEDDLANIFEEVNRITFEGRRQEERMLTTMSTKRLGAFISCNNSKEKKKGLKTDESVKNLIKRKTLNINIPKAENKSLSEYVSMFEKQLTSKSVYHTERSIDNSKNATFSKNSISKLLSNRNLLEVEKKIRPFEKQKITEKKSSPKDFNKSQKVLDVKRKKRV